MWEENHVGFGSSVYFQFPFQPVSLLIDDIMYLAIAIDAGVHSSDFKFDFTT